MYAEACEVTEAACAACAAAAAAATGFSAGLGFAAAAATGTAAEQNELRSLKMKQVLLLLQDLGVHLSTAFIQHLLFQFLMKFLFIKKCIGSRPEFSFEFSHGSHFEIA
jgi:hypothetical protein